MLVAAEECLKDAFGGEVSIKSWHGEDQLPIYLKDYYAFYELTVLGIVCLLLEAKSRTAASVNVTKQHLKRIEGLTDQQCVLYAKHVTWYRRRSLIEHGVAFITDDGQVFLPFIGTHLRKRPQSAGKALNGFSPATQLVYLLFLYNRDMVINTSGVAEALGFSLMTASRVLNDLYDAGLLTYAIGGKTGRSKEYRRIPDPEYFMRGKDFVRRPFKKLIHVRKEPEGAFVSGLDALAGLSMINPPKKRRRAIGPGKLNDKATEVVHDSFLALDEPIMELELWDYEPGRFAVGQHVDLMSLYSCLREEKDERVEKALEEVLRGEAWYTG